ncbi:unnamed protein product [Heterosigma akashiwo]
MRAKIAMKGWIPRQPHLNQDHKFKIQECELAHSSVGLTMFKDGEFSDVSLVCQQEQTFRCHRAILSAWSPVFKAMFSHSNMAEGQTNEVTIQDVKPSVMEALLKFMYGGLLECEPGDELDLLAASQKYSVQYIKKQCEQWLVSSLEDNPSYVPQVLAFTSLHDDLECLHYAALRCLNEKKFEVVSSEGWKSFCKQSPLVALEVLNETTDKFEKGGSVESCKCWEK